MNPFLSSRVQNNLVLASASSRRSEILKNLGFEFEVVPPQVDEDVFWDKPERRATLLAEIKAVDVQGLRPRNTIIAADTIVVCENRILEKPLSEQDAMDMLTILSGRFHEVITGVALLQPPNFRILDNERTKVYFRSLDKSEIEIYIDTGEPYGKAGAYAIQGFASPFIEKVEGCYFNVVGLPVSCLFTMFRKLEREISRFD